MSTITVNMIRICGALFIFLCHACNESGNAWGTVLGQVFNIGVPIFFMLSGCLHSMKAAPRSAWKWYGKKLKRLLIPLYTFLAGLAVIYAVTGNDIIVSTWLQTLVPVCGLTQNYISGCGQLWFLTHLLVCYLVTPAMQRHNPASRLALMLCVPLWLAAAVLLAYSVPEIWCTLFNSLFTYFVGFYVLPRLLDMRLPMAYPLAGGCLRACCGCCAARYGTERRFTTRLRLNFRPLY